MRHSKLLSFAWKILHKKTVAITTALVLVVSIVFSGPVLAVWNGIIGEDEDTYFTIYQPVMINGETLITGVATASAITHKGIEERCFISAQHVPSSGEIVKSIDYIANPPTPAHQEQEIKLGRYGDVMPRVAHWRDIKVVWITNYEDDGDDARLHTGDYVATEIGEASEMGIEPLDMNEPALSLIDYTIQGFGERNAIEGSGTLHHGFVRIVAYILYDTFLNYSGPFVEYMPHDTTIFSEPDVKGAVFTTFPKTVSGIKYFESVGDSGTPLFAGTGENKKVVAVLSGPNAFQTTNSGSFQDPENIEAHFYSAFNSHGTITKKIKDLTEEDLRNLGNYEQVVMLVNQKCTKELRILIEGGGRVDGEVESAGQALETYLDNELNKEIGCSTVGGPLPENLDCIEYIHQPETIHLEAVPSEGWEFVRWETVLLSEMYHDGPGEEAKCECEESNPVCDLSYEDIGLYTSEHSYDLAVCKAIFAPTQCGNAFVNAGEYCDEGGNVSTALCDLDCTEPVCGDHIVNDEAGEECDDGNTANDDGCSSTCEIEDDPVCGNSVVERGEECDDGNTNDTDGCSHSCQLEYCGDGYITSPEQCDDGNNVNGDGCSSSCTEEEGDPVCGDGVTESPEACDDGNTTNGDGCSSECTVEEDPVCGNSIVESPEQCDDGNTTSGDGCSSYCLTEGGACVAGINGQGGSCSNVPLGQPCYCIIEP